MSLAIYPAGVTGYEAHIAGVDQRDITVVEECDHSNSELFGVKPFHGQVEAVEWARSSTEVVTSWTCPICLEVHADERDPAEDGI